MGRGPSSSWRAAGATSRSSSSRTTPSCSPRRASRRCSSTTGTSASSDGARRQHIDPWMQIEDYKNAISFAETLDEVDAARIGVWGLSYSGGHALIVGGDRSAREVHRVADPGRRRLPQHAPRPRHDRLPRLRGGDHATTASPLRDGRGRHGRTRRPTRRTRLSTWPFPETYETFLELKAARGARATRTASTIESAELLMSYNVEPFLPRLLDIPTLVVVAERTT